MITKSYLALTIISVSLLFGGCNLNDGPREQLLEMIRNGDDVTNIDTSAITDMHYLFISRSDFNQDISGWDVCVMYTKNT